MELWVRSQKKDGIVKCYDIEMDSFNLKKDKVLILNCRNSTDAVVLGEYNTEERALEVLDEINEILQLKFCATLGTFEEVFKGYTEKQLRLVLKQMAVYEMPKE